LSELEQSLELRQHIEFRVAVLVWLALIGQAPACLTDLCSPSLSARSTRHLRSAVQSLHVLIARTSTLQSRGWPFGLEWSPIGSPDTTWGFLPEIPSTT